MSVWPSPIVAHAPAKVNLCLLVGPRRKDGYHPVFSVFAPLDLHDEIVFRLRATPGTLPDQPCSSAGLVTVECPGVVSRDNLVTRALKMVEEATGWCLAGHVDVLKSIPAAAGLGGGSSDAATALVVGSRVVADSGGPPLGEKELHSLARRLGADVPFLHPLPAIATGVGDVLRPLPLPTLPLVLYLPQEELATSTVYAKFDHFARSESDSDFAGSASRLQAEWVALSEQWDSGALGEAEAIERMGKGLFANDLYAASLALLPELAGRAAVLSEHGAAGVLMSGSGSTMFGVWGSHESAEAATRKMESAGYPVRQVQAGSPSCP